MQYGFAETRQKTKRGTAPHPALRATLPKGEGMCCKLEKSFLDKRLRNRYTKCMLKRHKLVFRSWYT